MGRMYSIPLSAVAVTAAQDLWEIVVPADAVMRLHEVKVTQGSDAGDSASEQLRFTVKRVTGSPTSGSGGSAGTLVKHCTGDAAAGITAETNNTSRLSGGTSTTLVDVAENVHNGWHYLPTPEARIDFSPSEYCVIGLETAPADSLTMSGYAIVEEIGG